MEERKASQTPHLEADYVEQAKSWCLAYRIARSFFGAAPRKLAIELYRQGIPLEGRS